MKTLLSIGGWGRDKNFSSVGSNPIGRARFASTAAQFVKDLGFDGIDIDWEFLKTGVDAENFVLLLEALRSALDKYAEEYAPGYHFLMTVASPGGPREYNIFHLGAMDRYLDAWHLMAYDHSGFWDSHTGHAANLYGAIEKPKSTPYTIEKAVTAYIQAGVAPDKIILGIPVMATHFKQPLALDNRLMVWEKRTRERGVGIRECGTTKYFPKLVQQSTSTKNSKRHGVMMKSLRNLSAMTIRKWRGSRQAILRTKGWEVLSIGRAVREKRGRRV
jgi:chitinase